MIKRTDIRPKQKRTLREVNSCLYSKIKIAPTESNLFADICLEVSSKSQGMKGSYFTAEPVVRFNKRELGDLILALEEIRKEIIE